VARRQAALAEANRRLELDLRRRAAEQDLVLARRRPPAAAGLAEHREQARIDAQLDLRAGAGRQIDLAPGAQALWRLPATRDRRQVYLRHVLALPLAGVAHAKPHHQVLPLDPRREGAVVEARVREPEPERKQRRQ